MAKKEEKEKKNSVDEYVARKLEAKKKAKKK